MHKFGANLCERNNNLIQVMFTTVCNNGCPYCINAFAMDKVKRPDLDHLIFSTAKQLLRHVVEEESVVVITGGEPCLFLEDLDKFTEVIKTEFPYVKLVLQTALPTIAYKHHDVLERIIGRLEKMTYSLHAMTNEEQLQFTRSPDKFDKYQFLFDLSKKFPGKIEAQILLNNNFNTRELVDTCIDMLYENGIKHIKLVEVWNCESEHHYVEDVMRIKLIPTVYSCVADVPYPRLKDLHLNTKRYCQHNNIAWNYETEKVDFRNFAWWFKRMCWLMWRNIKSMIKGEEPKMHHKVFIEDKHD